MTLFIDRLITSYYSEKMEIDLSDIVDCKEDKKVCFGKYKTLYESWKKEDTTDKPKGKEEQCIKLLFDKLYENTYINLIKRYLKEDKRPLILFPVLDNDPTGDNYFSKNNLNKYKDSFLCIPVFSEYNETKEEFTEKIDNAIIKIKDNISKRYQIDEDQRRYPTFKPNSYTNLVIIFNNDASSFFTSMYKKELKKEKKDILNSKINELINRSSIEKQQIKLNGIKKESIKEVSTSYFKSELKKIDESSKIDRDFEQKIVEMISKLNESYKRVTDKKYLALVTSDEQASFLRIFYRVSLDKDINYKEIKPGNEYLYFFNPDKPIKVFNEKLYNLGSTGKVEKNPNYKGYVGLLNVVQGYKTRYTFQMHNKITKDIYDKQGDPNFKKEDADIVEDKDEDEEVTEEKYVKIQLEIRNKNGYIEAETVGKEKQKGKIEFYKDLHIYEKYRWFKFNDIDGSLPAETKINIYEDTLFDKNSLVKYLKYKEKYNDKLRLAVEFLKINMDKNLLLEYTSYIYTNLNKSNVYKKSIFGLSEQSFKEKCKKEIIDILFQPNELIYLGGGVRAKETKTDIRKNYKIISYNYITLDNFDTTKGPLQIKKDGLKNYNKLKSHLYSKNYSKVDEEEYKYCQKHKIDNCEFLKESIATNESRAIIIIDVTKENIDVKDLKKKTDCKRLKQTIKREARELFSSIKIYNPLMPLPFPYKGGKRSKRLKRQSKGKRSTILKSRKRRV
jgi:hypothetical protein